MAQAGGRIGRCAAAGLVAALAVVAVPAAAQPSLPDWLSPCLADRGDRDRYRAALADAGWDTATGPDRAAALAALADAFLPSITDSVDWADRDLRVEAAAEWDEFLADAPLFLRDGAALHLAGYRSDGPLMAVECWVALPDPALTEPPLAAGRADARLETYDGFVMVTAEWDESPTQAVTLRAVRLAPPADLRPPLAATDALLIISAFHPSE
jgi:hypothetical protein